MFPEWCHSFFVIFFHINHSAILFIRFVCAIRVLITSKHIFKTIFIKLKFKGVWGGGSFLASFLQISLWFFAFRPELKWDQKLKWGETNLPYIFVLSPCGVSKFTNFETGNSNTSPPFSIIFFLQKAHGPFWPLLKISLWNFCIQTWIGK